MDRLDVLTALALVVGFLLVVLVEKAVGAAGLEGLSALVYPVGYGSIVLVAWYVWIRPLDIRSPTPDDRVWRPDSPADGERGSNQTTDLDGGDEEPER